MLKYIVRISVLSLLAHIGSIHVYAYDNSPKKRFLDEYVHEVKKLKHFYGNARIRAIYISRGEFLQPPETVEKRRDLVFKGCDPNFLLETKFDKDPMILPNETLIQAVNRRYSFVVNKRPDAKNLLLKFSQNENGWQLVSTHGSFAFAPYCWNDETLEEFLGSEHTEIPKLEELVVDQRKLTKVFYHVKFKKLNYGGWFLFSPANSWALLEHGRETNNIKLHLVLSYEDLNDKLPRLKQVRDYGKDLSGVLEQKWNITEFTPGPVPEEEFRLSYYGLPEPKGVVWASSPSRWWLWLIAIALVSLVFGGYLRRRAHASKPNFAPSAAPKGRTES